VVAAAGRRAPDGAYAIDSDCRDVQEVGTNKDVPPYFMVTGIQIIGSVNIIGLRRSGMSADAIDDARWVFRKLYREGLSPKRSLETLHERADRPMVREYIDFIESSTRGITPGAGKSARGTA